jgi:hypothetical protein
MSDRDRRDQGGAWGRFTGVALVLGLLAGPTAFAADPSLGYQITPSGFLSPVYGSVLSRSERGDLVRGCRRMDAGEIAGRESEPRLRATNAVRSMTVQAAAAGLAFDVVFSDAPGTGFDDAALGAQRRAGLTAALAAWSRVLVGPISVTVQASFTGAGNPSLLASAAPTDFVVQGGKIVPLALASQVAAADLGGSNPDLVIKFNPDISWDYAVNGANAVGRVSFVYVAIHEIGHGLGFLDSFSPETGALANALPTPYDTFVSRGVTSSLLLARSPDEVRQDLVSDDLYFSGPNAMAASQASIRPQPMIKLFAPNPYRGGSSIAHVDQARYSDIRVGLMTPEDFGPGSDRVDTLTLGIFADMGYVTDPSGAIR